MYICRLYIVFFSHFVHTPTEFFSQFLLTLVLVIIVQLHNLHLYLIRDLLPQGSTSPCVDTCTSWSSFLNCRYRRDARSLDEDEELWFNDDDDDDDGEAVEKRMGDDFSDSYGKYMEAKKGKLYSLTVWMLLDSFSQIVAWS